jgi:hypothetical protein
MNIKIDGLRLNGAGLRGKRAAARVGAGLGSEISGNAWGTRVKGLSVGSIPPVTYRSVGGGGGGMGAPPPKCPLGYFHVADPTHRAKALCRNGF